MKNRIIVLLFVIVSFPSLLNSIIWEIKQDGSGDFTTIQAGIDASAANSDTVLVYPGTYYENLEILDKSLTLGSLYLTTGDESWVAYTILDGNQTSSVIRIEDNSPYNNYVNISGFVIQNGIGYQYGSLGRKDGGGIYANGVDFKIENCIVQNNKVNHSGGGIALKDSQLNLSKSTLRFNASHSVGGGIMLLNGSSVNFDYEELNSIYLNHASVGNDIYISHLCPIQSAILDTFTVIDPDDNYYFIYPSSGGGGIPLPGLFTINIQHGYVEQVEQNLYVSPDGDDDNSGLSPTDALKTIAYAMVKIRSDSLQQRTVHVMDGTYSVSQNDQIWPIQIKSHIDIIGESMENTILDGEHQDGFFVGESGQKNYFIQNFSLLNNQNILNIKISCNTNAYFKNLYAYDGFCQVLFSNQSDVTLENVIQSNTTGGEIYCNSSLYDGVINLLNCKVVNNYGNIPIYCYQASNVNVDSLTVNIINTEVTDNLEIGSEWMPRTCAIKIDWGTKLNLINSTIGNNTSLHTGAAVQLVYYSQANIVNSIIYGNLPYNLCLNGADGATNLTAYNSLIEGGVNGILNIGTNYIDWHDDTMLNEDPLWLGTGYDFPYALSTNSPCIDTGTLKLPYGVELPAYDLAGNPRVMGSAIDMGAYEFPDNPAPIYLQMDNETLFWQIPPGYSPSGYNVYLDWEYQSFVNVFNPQYTFSGLMIGESYTAGVSAMYDAEETAIISLDFIYQPVGIEEEATHLSPLTTHLSNYPNPFNPSTTISFSLTTENTGYTELVIYNIKGQKVKTLLDCTTTAGIFNCIWNGKDSGGKRVASGEYIVKLKVNGEEKAVRKMLLIK